jgi:pimeloyl-ACP methyl ester carboxylesterase
MSTGTPMHRPAFSARLKLGVVRAAFALGGRLAPARTVNRAARLFATPFASSRRRAQAAQAGSDVRRGQLQVNGETIATYVWGDPATQPYALLLHGWSSFGLRFLPWVDALRALGLAVVTFDQPGHGHSSGSLCTLPEFTATARAVGRHYGNAALAIAHSLGGAALAFAQDEQWRAEKCVLVAPAADMHAAAGRFFRLVRLGEHLRQPFFAWHRQRTGIDVDDLQIARRVRDYGQPCLVVHDLDDEDVPWGEGERYARHWPGARMLTTQGLGHRRVLDAPEVVAAVVAFARGGSVGERVVSSPNLPYGVA